LNDKSEKYALKSATGNPLGLSAFEKDAAPDVVTVPTAKGFQNPVATPVVIAIGLLFCPKSCPVTIVDGPENSAVPELVIVTELILLTFVVSMFVVPPTNRSFSTVTLEVLKNISCIVPIVNCGKTVT
tara:strand:- start:241 stop:624 length:384 start_codon:yes stop_codon:yes gene_type:complete